MYKLLLLGLLFVQQLVAEINHESRYSFAADLYNEIVANNTENNFVFSPASIQTSLALLYLGAGTNTEVELRKGLRFESYAQKSDIASDYKAFLDRAFSNTYFQLMLANRIYVDESYDVSPEFNASATQYFGSAVEKVKYTNAQETADKINNWVEAKTQNRIKNLVDPSSFNVDSALSIVNALYFKADWKYRFEPYGKDNFYTLQNVATKVPMMRRKKVYVRYAEIPSLDAVGIELPYKNSNLSMVVLLPNKIDGLTELDRKINTTNFKTLLQSFGVQQVNIYLPKFEFDFSFSVIEVLKKLGIRSMFNDASDLRGILQTARTLTVSEVKHKAFIAVNEKGTEAAAATFTQAEGRMLSFAKPKTFKADHPFLFAIQDQNAVYFMGHIVKL